MKLRIVERTHPDGDITFVIQTKKWWHGWLDVDAFDDWGQPRCETLEEAKAILWMYDGSKKKDKVVWEAEDFQKINPDRQYKVVEEDA